MVTVNPTSFTFSVEARDMANLKDMHWMRVHTDPDERLIVFEPFAGLDKRPGLLKLGTSNMGHKRLTAKGLIAQRPWIKAVAALPLEQRKFEIKPYLGPMPPSKKNGEARKPWYIQLMPAFEEFVIPSQIDRFAATEKGIYRYWSDDEVVYIGKGNIRERFQSETERKNWLVSKIEYSVIEDDQEAFEWESWWIERFREENNGHRPRFNKVGGHRDA